MPIEIDISLGKTYYLDSLLLIISKLVASYFEYNYDTVTDISTHHSDKMGKTKCFGCRNINVVTLYISDTTKVIMEHTGHHRGQLVNLTEQERHKN